MPVTTPAKVSKAQKNMVLARLSELGYKSDQDKFDWLFERDVNVNDFGEITQEDLHHVIVPKLLKEEHEGGLE